MYARNQIASTVLLFFSKASGESSMAIISRTIVAQCGAAVVARLASGLTLLLTGRVLILSGSLNFPSRSALIPRGFDLVLMGSALNL